MSQNNSPEGLVGTADLTDSTFM